MIIKRLCSCLVKKCDVPCPTNPPPSSQRLWNTFTVLRDDGLSFGDDIALKSVAFLTRIVYTNKYPPRFFGSWARGRESGLCFFSGQVT